MAMRQRLALVPLAVGLLCSAPLYAASLAGDIRDLNGKPVAGAMVSLSTVLPGPTATTVFSDASGGTGLEPPLMGIYFDRPHFSLYDAFPATLPYARFQRQADDIDYLVVLPANRRLVEQYFGEAFQEALRVTEEGRGELLLVYARAGTFASRASMDVSVGDRQFDARYSLLCGG